MAPRELLGARHSEKRVETFSPIFIDLRENSSWEEKDWSKSLDLKVRAFSCSELKSRIAQEGNAITRAKEFLRRQRRSVQRRQVSRILD